MSTKLGINYIESAGGSVIIGGSCIEKDKNVQACGQLTFERFFIFYFIGIIFVKVERLI